MQGWGSHPAALVDAQRQEDARPACGSRTLLRPWGPVLDEALIRDLGLGGEFPFQVVLRGLREDSRPLAAMAFGAGEQLEPADLLPDE